MRRPPLPPLLTLLLCVLGPARFFAQPAPAAATAFNTYIASVESRLAQQHRLPSGFLAPIDLSQQGGLRQGRLVIDHLTPPGDAPSGAIIHHWRGAAFAPRAHIADFERIMRDFPSYPRIYAPQVLQAKVLSQHGDSYRVSMRVRQQHVIIILLDTDYDVAFARLDPQHVYSLSRSTQISEIASPGTSRERVLSPEDDHDFLWRLNTYWSCEERGGGLYLQVESVSLTRSIPAGLAWALRPFVESVPRFPRIHTPLHPQRPPQVNRELILTTCPSSNKPSASYQNDFAGHRTSPACPRHCSSNPASQRPV